MADGTSSDVDGRQYSHVRAALNTGALNRFIADRATAIAVPVTVKQFSVCLIGL